jgi:SH3 domain-containing YSC84-like protein 1
MTRSDTAQKLGRRSLIAGAAAAATLLPGMRPAFASREGAQDTVTAAATMVERMTRGGRGKAIKGILSRSAGVMLFPSLIKAGLIVGGEGGTGVILGRSDNGVWSAPAFYTAGSGSFGFQIGAQETQLMLIVMRQTVMKKFVGGGGKIGIDASAAAIDDGIDAEISTNNLQDIYFFANTVQGLYAGVSVEGTGIAPRTGLNKDLYGRNYSGEQIIFEGLATPTPEGQRLISNLMA